MRRDQIGLLELGLVGHQDRPNFGPSHRPIAPAPPSKALPMSTDPKTRLMSAPTCESSHEKYMAMPPAARVSTVSPTPKPSSPVAISLNAVPMVVTSMLWQI